MLLTLRHDRPLHNFAFNFNSRHYMMGRALFPGAGFLELGLAGALNALPIDLPNVEAAGATVVRRCSFNPSNPC